MEVNVITCLILFNPFVFAFRRDIQSRFDALEERYEQDYVVLKEDLRDIWTAMDHFSSNCCLSRGPPANAVPKSMTTNKDGQLTINNHDNFAVINVSRSYDLLRKGMSDEKEFTRETFNQINESVTELENVCNKDMAKLAENLSGIDRNVNMMEKQLDKLKEYQQEVNRKLELERQSTMEKYRDLQVQMKEEIEKSSKRDIFDRPSSCMDLFRNGITSSGVYTLYHQMQTFIVFCLFKKEGGYTFIYPEILIQVDINSLSNDNSHVLIRHRRTNGVQYESRIEQITRYQSRPISVQYNSHVAYQGPVNSLMTPYI